MRETWAKDDVEVAGPAEERRCGILLGLHQHARGRHDRPADKVNRSYQLINIGVQPISIR